MKRWIVLILGISLITGGCKKKSPDKENKGDTGRPAPEVVVAQPEQQDVVYTYQYPAYLEALQTVNLVARVSGFLQKVNYIPGRAVKTGDLLFIIEPQSYLDQLNSAQAAMKSMKAQLAYSKAQYERMKETIPGKAISEIDFIQAESDYHTAIANLENARAQLNTARINLNYCYVKAPFDGHVSRNMIDAGNFVGGSIQPVTLATIYKEKTMYAYFNMAYPEFRNLPVISSTASLPLTITDASDSTRTWQGRLDYSSPNVDLQTGTVAVRAIAENPGGELLSGMYVTITVPYKQVKNALVIPESSIGTGQAGRYVYLVNDENRVVQQAVKVGFPEPGGAREIISGVTANDRYVLQAMMTVRPGMTVKPVSKKDK